MTASGGLFAGFYPGAVGSAIADRQRTARGRELGHAARGRASSGMLPLPPPPAPPLQLAPGGDRVGRVRTLVGAVALHAGAPQRQPPRISRARLDVVACDLPPQLRPRAHRLPVAS